MTERLTFDSLSPIEKAWMCNGCGPKLSIAPNLVPQFIFHEACQAHDFAYWRGHTAQDRYDADRRFRHAMLGLARQHPSWIGVWWYRFLAWRYYWAVRVFGSKAFSYRERYGTREDLEREMRESP